MKRLPYERPMEHYDERITDIDEQLCSLIRRRKEASDQNPGFPPFELITGWAGLYGLQEEFVKAVFGTLLNEEHFQPMVEPVDFRKHIPVLKSLEQRERFFTLTSIRQYSNATVIILNVDWDAPELQFERQEIRQHYHYQLFAGEGYDCRMMNGGSRADHASYKFVVSPPLPDDLTGIEFRFQEHVGLFDKTEPVNEIIFEV